MPKSVGEALWKLMNKIWKKGRIPQDWREGIIYAPSIKKRGKERSLKITKNVAGHGM